MVSVLSQGQIACLPYVSLTQMLNEGISEEEGCGQIYNDISSTLQEGEGAVSVYNGINREMFSVSGVAVTSTAKEYTNTSNANYMSGFLFSNLSNTTNIILLTTLATALVTGVVLAVNKVAYTKFVSVGNAVAHDVTVNIYNNVLNVDINDVINMTDDTIYSLKDFNAPLDPLDNPLPLSTEFYDGIEEQIHTTQKLLKVSNITRYIGMAMCLATAIMSAISVWQTIADLQAYYNQQRTPVPKYLVDSATGDGKIKNFTYYTAVTCNRQEGGFDATDITSDPSVLADFADLNGDVGKEWLALYYTKNENAGGPITTDILLQADNKNISDQYTALTMFGSKAAINLNDEDYLYGDGEPLYLLFSRDQEAGLAGSTFGGDQLMLLALLAVILGIAGCVVIRYRKKEDSVSLS